MALTVPDYETGPGGRLVRTAILLFCTATLLIICLKVIGQGYYPPDDALRHVAKVVSGKDWNEILVIRDEIKMDSHPGWHKLLGLLYKTCNAGPTVLLNFSVIILFVLFVMTPAFLFRRPEAWIASLCLFSVFYFGPLYRIFLGRPFIFTMFLALMFCFLWPRIRDKEKPCMELSLYAFLVAVSTWIHGTWFFLSLPLLALFLARQWRVFLLMGVATILGIIIGASLTGHPVMFLKQTFLQAVWAFGSHDFQRQLVTELRPHRGESIILLLVSLFLLWRKVRGEWDKNCLDNPIFILGMTGWVMGFVAIRLWTDWGWPAMVFWFALEIQTVLEKHVSKYDIKSLAATAVLCLVLFLSMTSDWGERWSERAIPEWPRVERTEQKPWLPEGDGILYSDSMYVFYQVFFQNPAGSWRYMLGFEPVWMPEEDLKIYRHIQLTRGKDSSYDPWIKKMTDKDRMILIRNSEPEIGGLVWQEVAPTVWSGRIEEKTSGPGRHG